MGEIIGAFTAAFVVLGPSACIGYWLGRRAARSQAAAVVDAMRFDLLQANGDVLKAAHRLTSCETGGPGGITSTLSYIQKAGGEPVLGPWANGLMEIIVWEGLEPGASYTVWSAFEAQSVHGQCEIESNRITVTTKPLSNPDPDPDPEPEPEPPVEQTQQECLSDAGVRVGGPSNPAWDPRVGKCMPADEVDKADLKKLAKGCQDCMELHGGRGFSLENTAMAALSPRAKRNLKICLLGVGFVFLGLSLAPAYVTVETIVLVGAGFINLALVYENAMGPVAERLAEKVKKAWGELFGNRLSADNGGVGNFTVKVQSTNPDALAFSFADNGDLVFHYGAAEPAAFVWTLLEDGERSALSLCPTRPAPPRPNPTLATTRPKSRRCRWRSRWRLGWRCRRWARAVCAAVDGLAGTLAGGRLGASVRALESGSGVGRLWLQPTQPCGKSGSRPASSTTASTAQTAPSTPAGARLDRQRLAPASSTTASTPRPHPRRRRGARLDRTLDRQRLAPASSTWPRPSSTDFGWSMSGNTVAVQRVGAAASWPPRRACRAPGPARTRPVSSGNGLGVEQPAPADWQLLLAGAAS